MIWRGECISRQFLFSATTYLAAALSGTKMTARFKNLSSTIIVVLSILDCFGSEGAYLDEVCDEYDALGLAVGKRSICTYMNRVAKLDLLRTTKEKDGSGRTIYFITKAGKKELDWWRSLVNAAA